MEMREAIDGHVRLLLAWTTAINLTAIREPAAVATAHVLDSLSGLAVIAGTSGAAAPPRFLDLGSGGGFPGIPLAAALPGWRALLVEPIAKKARFLETALEAIGLDDRVRVATTRAEGLGRDPEHRGRWPIVVARAVATTADLIELALPLLGPGGRLIAWKRGDIAQELRQATAALEGLGGGEIAVLDVPTARLPGHRLVVVTRRGVVPDDYPRDPAQRRRRPW
jgi:16S rRNA (guanine527-N7)-methyltransferase